jgi:transcriptional regulator with XRE-family HTH domain
MKRVPSKKTRVAIVPEAEQKDQKARTFGLSVKAMRTARTMTLEQLAGLTGLNKGYLSRLERNEKAPSIATVLKIAQALSVPLSTLFGEAVDEASIHLVRAAARPNVNEGQADGYVFAPLSRASGSTTDAFLMYPPAEFGADGRVEHGGSEIFFVLDGTIEVQFADRTVGLREGDFLQFPGHLAHQVRRLSKRASALVIVSRE